MPLSPHTSKKLAKGYQELRRQQAAGEAPLPGEVSAAEYAAVAGVSEPTIRTIESIAIAKLYHGLTAKGVSHKELRQLFKVAPPQP